MSSLCVQAILTGVRPVATVVCFCCSFLWSVQSAMASELDDIRLPVDASAQWVSPNLTHNGMSIAVKRFVSPRAVAYHRTLGTRLQHCSAGAPIL